MREGLKAGELGKPQGAKLIRGIRGACPIYRRFAGKLKGRRGGRWLRRREGPQKLRQNLESINARFVALSKGRTARFSASPAPPVSKGKKRPPQGKAAFRS